ncbi:Retrovirus-related Pol polyprotein from transposon 17.6 [Vitis vinifera]|uniref:Retrovirus-related Pol polyprotein from transposon 17.6 n=1 Tax=Vitis vinifera TaxID=29760 RepID=A0A438CSM8_VITVI|nr:Retrovirus-related Pol polyprotein from transposon 17.6 [Vitis vinifera]
MSFDRHGSTVVLDIMRSMSYLPGMGLGRRQHGLSEFIAIPNHDVPFGLGFVPTEADYLYMARLRKERVRARLTHTPFYYPLRPYTRSLADYFVRASEPHAPSDGIVGVLSTTQEAELQRLVQQLRLRDGAPGSSTSVLIAPSSPDRTSLMTLCFPDEIDEHGTLTEPGLASSFDLFGVFVIELAEESLTVPALESVEDLIVFDDLIDSHVGIVEGASDFVDPPLSFDVLSGFVSRSDYVSDVSSMDLSIFEYLPVSCDIDLSAPSSPTSQIFDIDDEVAQHDSDDDSSSVSDSDPVDQRVSPAVGDTKIVDFGTTDQPRELRIGSDLSTDERDSLIQLLRAYLDVFAWSYEDMPGLDPSIVQHRLPLLPHARPVKQKLRRLHPRWSLQVKEEIQKQLSVGFLSVVEYPEWLANVVPVPKKDGKVRVCVDFRDLNKASPKDDFPLPHIDMLVDSTAGHSMLSFMDGFSGYSQILMAPEDMEKTSFITEWGTYCYRVMPFGLKNAGATYQRAATTLFHDMMHRDVEVYVDDMIVKSRGRSDHLAALERFFERIRQFRLRLNPKKCTFGVTSGKLLGYMVSERGIEVDPDKIRAILDMSAPRTEREVRGFLGRLQYISRFIARLTDICEPIFRLLRKSQPTVWDDQCQRAFERIREYLLSPPVLAPPTPGRPLLLYLSVSDVALGCMLAQLDDSGKDRAIYYLSKRMLDYETRYVTIERYCLALVWATRRLRHYMTEYSVHLISRLDPLRYLFDRPALVGRLMRWLVLLTEFDIHYVTQKSIRGSIVADHLASLPVSDARAIDDDFPDEDVAAVTSLSGWRMYFDGAANHSGYGIGVLLISPHGDHIPRSVRLAFSDRHPATNNIIQGEWKTRDAKLRPYHAYLELLVGRFDDLRYTHLPRAQNQFADALATLASMIDIPANATVRPLLIESRSAPAYCCLIDDMEIDDGLPWYHDIYHFLRLGVYPEAATAKDRRALRQLATRFVICGETLYRRSPEGMLLLCLDRASADRVMREVHAGVCGPHMGGHMLARKIMRTGYFWLTMETDCCQFVQRCPECQIHGDLIHVPPSELHALTSPWPFSVWGIDIIGKISPKSSSGHEFILVAIDYFTKWVEAASYARLTSSGVASFIRSHIICRYGVPHELISDRGVHFRAEVDTLVQRYGIRHHRSSAYRPQTNGAVEAANKNIKRILRKMVETSRDWSEKLPFALWAYRTSFRTSTGATPYSLVYGMEAVLPVEIEMGSLRVTLEQQIPETDWAQARFDQLNLLDERRLRAADHVRAYQRKMARAFKKRVKPRPLHVGDLVLRVIRGVIRDPRGKFRPSWSGPYFIRELTPEGVAWLMDLDGNQFSEPTNVDQLKRHLYDVRIRFSRVWITGITCLMRDDSMSPVFSWFVARQMPYWGIFRFGGSLWIFAEVTCSRIEDSMLSDLRPILHFDAIQGHISVRMRFTDHEGVACLSLFARSRFILFDIVVIPGWGYLRTDRIHLMPYWGIFPSFSREGDRSLALVRRSRLVEPLLAISSSLRFAAACHTGAYFPHIVSLQSSVQSCRSFTVYDIQSHHVTFFFVRRSEPLLSLTFRVITITSQLDVQSHHHHLSVSAFRAVIGFQIDVQSRVLGFGVQSRYHFSASAFRVIITASQFRCSEPSSVFRSTFRVPSSVSAFRVVITSQFDVQSHHHHFSVSAFGAIISFQIDIQSRILDRHSELHPRFRRSESLSLLSLTFRVIIITSQFRRSELSSIFRSTFRVASSVSAFRVVITSHFDVQSHHHHFSVSAFRAIIGFQIDIQSRILGFGVQSRYHFSV